MTRPAAPPRVPAHRAFFPLATAFAAVALPASVAAMLGHAPWLPGLATPGGHAHEMLFGFALAVITGNQLGPTPRTRLALLVAIWIGARMAYAVAPASLMSAALNAAFPVGLALILGPRLAGRSLKLRNRALPASLIALCAIAVALEFRGTALAASLGMLRVAVVLLAFVMLFMGARIIAPAIAGQLYRQGDDLQARVQPRLEAALIGAMLAAVLLLALGRGALATALGAAALVVAAIVSAVRMARWRLWTLASRPDLACLAVGYAWVIAGVAALGAALLAGLHATAAVHLITVGAMGTLTINVMALTWLRLARRDTARARLPLWATGLVALATLTRVAADFPIEARGAVLAFASACWLAAYAVLLVQFRQAPQPKLRR